MRWFVELRRTTTSQIEVEADTPHMRDVVAQRVRGRMDLGEDLSTTRDSSATVLDTRSSDWEIRSTRPLREVPRRVISAGGLGTRFSPPSVPLLGEADPELERLLQEEEAIEKAGMEKREKDESLAHVTSAMLQIVDHRDELKASQDENPQFSHNAFACPICVLAHVVNEVVKFGRRFEQ